MIQAGLLAAMLAASGLAGPAQGSAKAAAASLVADQSGINRPGNGNGQPGIVPPPKIPGATHGGVIRPPEANIDPHMMVTPPRHSGASMPVIPPPGTPGGAPNVEPK